MKFQFEKVRAIQKAEVNKEDVICIEADVNYSIIYLKGGKKIHLAKTLKQCHKMLEGDDFIRPSRSYLINLYYLKKMTDTEITLKNGFKMPVSRRKRKLLEPIYGAKSNALLKKISFLVGLLLITLGSFAQSVTIEPNTLRLPVVNDLNSITSPNTGMMVYKSNESSVYVYTGAQWVKVDQSAGLPVPFNHSEDYNGALMHIHNSNDQGNATGLQVGINHSGRALVAQVTSQGEGGTAIFVDNADTTFAGVGVSALVGKHATALYGYSPAGKAVSGNSPNGTAGRFVSQNYISIDASSTNGVAASLSSTNDYALKTIGKLRFSGEGMSPQAGFVLTAKDGSGDAEWAPLIPNYLNGTMSQSLFSVSNDQIGSLDANALKGSVSDLGTAVSGTASAIGPTNHNYGVLGINASENSYGYGVKGAHYGTGSGVYGESAEGIGVFAKSDLNTALLANTVSGDAVVASSTHGMALAASSQEDNAIYAYSLNGNSIETVSSVGIGLITQSIDSTALVATSTNGIAAILQSPVMALKTSGNVEFGGAQMQPATGKVLKAINNTGQAMWQNLFPVSTSQTSVLPILELQNTHSNSDQTRTILAKNVDEGVAMEGVAEKLSPTTTTVGVLGVNKSTGQGGYGVRGTHNGSGVGVYGSAAAAGTGIQGVANNASGTAGFFSSQNGYALKLNGKVAISGGNTAPDAGKVLMASNSSGDATWQAIKQNPQIGFKAAMASQTVLSGGLAFLNILTPDFEDGGGVSTIIDQYTVPESGVYQVNISLAWDQSAVGETVLQVRKNATVAYEAVFNPQLKFQTNELTQVLKLLAGDYIEFGVYQFSGSSKTITQSTSKNHVSVVKLY